jgi:hypothetical protein
MPGHLIVEVPVVETIITDGDGVVEEDLRDSKAEENYQEQVRIP